MRRKRSIEYLTDCKSCMTKHDQERRQGLGCGWEPRPKLVQIRPWSPSALDMQWKGKIETCPGYTTALPEVVEISRARLHWKQGGLRDFCGDAPTDVIRLGVEILEGASNDCNRWSIENPEKKANA